MTVLIFRSDPKLSPTDSPESSNQIENITDPGVPDAAASRINNCDHCICCNCKPMPTSEESICCKEMKIGLHIVHSLKRDGCTDELGDFITSQVARSLQLKISVWVIMAIYGSFSTLLILFKKGTIF